MRGFRKVAVQKLPILRLGIEREQGVYVDA
jgi:hypothetical protein